ncbi:uncharacterized protein Gasu_21190 [Galdieria sulphuraria]|uniref:Uncharacterized protein n=1 Tax=Galdieria sulphuraria TaxID=130081 RepID=M2XKJ8_GALSU|nr:uncharacterized protein Gasu_21190 [Galdieria sulphuraria]EME30662.1 hypothetical protein Gasu_21190 [Galdieria sulphuraria]|eukprot:XP_005707182.1 hypothetical protein Gasu_21190 [Galdieria sulphuraria]
MEVRVEYYENKTNSKDEYMEGTNGNPIPEYIEAFITHEDLDCDKVSPLQFLTSLRMRGLCHPIIQHPYFVNLAKGTLPNVPLALLDFALQKMKLCEHFHGTTNDHIESGCTTIIPSTGDNVSDPLSRLVHLDQMRSAPAGVAHDVLLKRFLAELEREVEEPLIELVTHKLTRTKNLGPRLSEICRLGNIPFVIGVLCCKVPPVISEIYKLIIEAIENNTNLPLRAYFFFRYCIEVESVLLGVLERLAEENLTSSQTRIDAAKGYWASLNIVFTYFMEMYDRSSQFPPKRTLSTMEYLTTRLYRPLTQEIVYEEDEASEETDSESNFEASLAQKGCEQAPSSYCSMSPSSENSNELDDDYANLSLPRNILDVESEYRKASAVMKLYYGEEAPLEEDLRRLSLNV